MHSNPDNKIAAGDMMAVNAVQHIDEGQKQSGQASWGNDQGERAPVDIENNSTAPVNMVQRIEGEDMQQQDTGHKGLMGKVKGVTRRLKDKVKGTVNHGKDNDTDYFESTDNKSITAADAVYSQHANVNTAYTGGSDSHESQPDIQYAGESGYGGEKGHVYGKTTSELQRPGHFFVAGVPSSGDVQKGESPYAASHGIPHTVSAPQTPADDVKDYSSMEAIDGSTGGFGAVARPGKTDPYSSTSPFNYGPGQYSSVGGEGMGSGLQKEGDGDINSTQRTPAAGHGLKDLLGDVDASGLSTEVDRNQQNQGLAVRQSEGSYTGYNPRGVEDEMGIQRMNASKLGGSNEGGVKQPGSAHTGHDVKYGVYNPPGYESEKNAPASKGGWGVTAAKDAVIGSTAAAMSKASGVTSMVAEKVGLGQQRTNPGMTGDTGVVNADSKVERFEGEGGKLQSEGHVSMGEEVKPEGYLSAATRKLGEGKDAVAQRFGYGGGPQEQMGVVDNQRAMALHDKERSNPQPEGYLSSVTRTLGDGKDLVAERFGYGTSNWTGQQQNANEAVVSDKGVEGKKSGGGVMGAVSGTIGAVTGTVGGVKDSVLRNLGYGEDQKMVDKEEGENRGMTAGTNRSMTGGELDNSSTPSSGGTWTDSAYGMASSVAGMATKAKDVVVDKVGMGKGNDGGGLGGMNAQQEGMRVSGGGSIAQQESGQKEGQGVMKSVYDTVGKTAGAVKGAVASRIGYGGTGDDMVGAEEGTALPSGYGKVREDLSDLTIGEKAGEKVVGYNSNTEAAKHTAPTTGNHHGVV